MEYDRLRCHIRSLSHWAAVTLSHCHTESLSHWDAVTQSRSHTESLSQRLTVTQRLSSETSLEVDLLLLKDLISNVSLHCRLERADIWGRESLPKQRGVLATDSGSVTHQQVCARLRVVRNNI